ncbi:MAG: hypothetical protein IMW83_03865 [Caldanaerobacter subterraneus]|nr:hypothetical protein [Caldanaerobacter subterraneus]
MKVKDFIEKYQLNEIFELALKEFDEEIPYFPYLLLPIVNEEHQIDEKYTNFYNMLKTLQPDENIKGKITVTFFFDMILDCENSKNERLEFLSWEEVLALDIIISEEHSFFELLFFISELLYRMTMHGKAFDEETKNRLIYEERIKESLIPKMNSVKEKLIKAVREITSIFDSFAGAVLFAGGLITLILILARYSFFFAVIFASLIDISLDTLLIKILFILAAFVIFRSIIWLYDWADNYLDKTFKAKLKQNIENYLKEHPEATSFLSTEHFESLDYYF